MCSSRVHIFDTAGRAADITDNALHAGHSRDRLAVNIPNTVATADNVGAANIADSEHSGMDRSKDHIPGLEGRGRLRRAN
jgi:hypothetical protein